ncbi:phage tail assembly protein T [Pseudomonas fulva]|uniref:phage tail assembly protein T n=1 Tax=Pseudomonas fulva TaxID=47880 RepID=UPI0018A99496|nr:DUF4035 domain-containing protein [Pseudomonas fulva]MBF8694901.1 DUF4035 domain-containing protein [Pseudomonas fulva]
MALALRLGRTLSELDHMPAEEYFLWRAFDQQSPLSDARGDVLAAMVAAAPLQAAGMKISAADMLPPWSTRPEQDEEEPEASAADTFFAYLQGRAAIERSKEQDSLRDSNDSPP